MGTVVESGTNFIEVGKVTAIIDTNEKKFQVKVLTLVGSHANSKYESCLKCKWNMPRSCRQEEWLNWSQTCYFGKLNRDNKLPAAVIRKVKERKLKWAREE